MTDIHLLAGAYALDALDGDELTDFETHLAECSTCQREVAEFRATAALLGEAAAEAPPASLKQSVLDQVDVTRQLGPQSSPTAPSPPPSALPPQEVPASDVPAAGAAPLDELDAARSRRFGANLPALAAAAAVVLVAMVGAVLLLTRDSTSRTDAVLAAADAHNVELNGEVEGAMARFAWSAEEAGGVLIADGLAAPADGFTYQLWLIVDGVPVDVGTFEPDADGRAELFVPGDHRIAQVVAFTQEVDGGVDAPTSAILMAGEFA